MSDLKSHHSNPIKTCLVSTWNGTTIKLNLLPEKPFLLKLRPTVKWSSTIRSKGNQFRRSKQLQLKSWSPIEWSNVWAVRVRTPTSLCYQATALLSLLLSCYHHQWLVNLQSALYLQSSCPFIRPQNLFIIKQISLKLLWRWSRRSLFVCLFVSVLLMTHKQITQYKHELTCLSQSNLISKLAWPSIKESVI